jgi:hypothetical protein
MEPGGRVAHEERLKRHTCPSLLGFIWQGTEQKARFNPCPLPNNKTSNSALISAENTLDGTYTLKPVPSAALEPSVKTKMNVSHFSEIIEDKQTEDTVRRKSSGNSTIALRISFATTETHRSAQAYDIPC